MPTAAARACTRPGCAGIVRNGECSRCGSLRKASDRAHDRGRGTAAQRGYGARWQRLRWMKLNDQPLCVDCLNEGRVTPATEVDHITPKRAGGTDAWENLQSLCKSCHSRKTAGGE